MPAEKAEKEAKAKEKAAEVNIKKREAALSSAQKRNMMLAAQMAHLESPAQLEAECQQYNLSLVAPKENQVVRLYEPGPEWDMQMANAPQLYFYGNRWRILAKTQT